MTAVEQLDIFDAAEPDDVVPPTDVCVHGTGPYTNAGGPDRQWWVHAHPECRRPTAGWLAAQAVTR